MAETKYAVFAQFGALAPQARQPYDSHGDASLKALVSTPPFGDEADKTVVQRGFVGAKAPSAVGKSRGHAYEVQLRRGH